MGGFIITLSLFITFIFPILISLFGLSYMGKEDGPLYILTVCIINFLSVSYIVYYETRNHRKARGNPLVYILPLLFCFLYLFEYAVGWVDVKDPSFLIFRNSIAISMVGILAGVFCVRYNRFEDICKNTELLMLLCTISLIFALPSMYSNGYNSSIGGGGGHQTISYVSAFAFGMNYCRIKFNPTWGYQIFRTHFYKSIAYVFLASQIVICLIGGGRGGVVLLIVLALLSLLYTRESIIKLLSVVVLCFFVLYFAGDISFWGIGEMISKGTERAFAFIGDSSIDLAEGASGRDYVYEKALMLIVESPAIGYGFFRQYDLCEKYFQQPYSHNLFIELMLQGGMLLTLIFSIIFIKFTYCLHRLVRRDNKNAALIAFSAFPFVMLMFSGSYLSTPLFWFVVLYVIGCHSQQRNIK